MKRTIKYLLFLGVIALALNSCYYDKYNELTAYKKVTNPCDTVNLTYTKHAAKVFNTYCVSCHSKSLASGNFAFDSYDNVMKVVNNTANRQKLINSIDQKSGAIAMPQGSKLSECNIKIIENWINSGAVQ